MTGKELAYVEDAIGHEGNIISICEDIKERLEDENLIAFMENKIETHVERKQNLLNLLEEKNE